MQKQRLEHTTLTSLYGALGKWYPPKDRWISTSLCLLCLGTSHSGLFLLHADLECEIEPAEQKKDEKEKLSATEAVLPLSFLRHLHLSRLHCWFSVWLLCFCFLGHIQWSIYLSWRLPDWKRKESFSCTLLQFLWEKKITLLSVLTLSKALLKTWYLK